MTPLRWVVGAAVFGAELALWTAWPVLGWRLARPAGPWAAGVAAAAALLLVVGSWAVWMAPTADRRLALWPRTAVACVLMVATGLGLAATGAPRAGLALACLGGFAMLGGQPALAA